MFTTPGRLAHGVVATAVDARRGRPHEGRPGDAATSCAGPSPPAGAARLADRDRARRRHRRDRPDDGGARPGRRARDSGRPHNAARMVFARHARQPARRRSGVELITGGVLADPDDRDLDRMFEGDEYAPDPAESAAPSRRDLADDLRDELVDHPGFHAAVERALAAAHPGAGCSPSCSARRPAGRVAQLRRDGHADSTCRPAPRRRRRLDGGGRAAARRAGRAARPAPPAGRPAASDGVRYAAEVLDARSTRHDRQIAGEDPDELRADRLRHRGLLAARFDDEHIRQRRRAGGRRPGLEVRASRRRRGAGALRHGLARAGPALPQPVDHRGRRPRAAQRARGSAGVGGRARPDRGRPLRPTGRSR